MTGPVQVLVVDDQPLIRHSLRLIVDGAPDLTVVGEAGTGAGALERTRELRPDIVLMDLRMPDGDGIEATRRIAADPVLDRTRVLVLTMFELDEYVHAALGAGASGFLLKDAEPARLVDAIRRTHAGESLFAPTVLARLVENYLSRSAPTSTPASLTGREAQVLTLVGRGLSNTEITRALTISMGTVKTHIGSLLSKLHARDRAQLVIAAYEHGLVGACVRPRLHDRD
ncbi:response regulator transcription factor [Occultella glacieicola]|uniref:Response regulator transcription factor n=1 Tax=Occultella glacieicola TaxID=2518684 RepID=A0ABY2E0I8_9MICO|nr:response regulator transcription factor [Occultella glacieicola]TDE90029.1 response regulator transcription factor [Occultella glacieicola]